MEVGFRLCRKWSSVCAAVKHWTLVFPADPPALRLVYSVCSDDPKVRFTSVRCERGRAPVSWPREVSIRTTLEQLKGVWALQQLQLDASWPQSSIGGCCRHLVRIPGPDWRPALAQLRFLPPLCCMIILNYKSTNYVRAAWGFAALLLYLSLRVTWFFSSFSWSLPARCSMLCMSQWNTTGGMAQVTRLVRFGRIKGTA